MFQYFRLRNRYCPLQSKEPEQLDDIIKTNNSPLAYQGDSNQNIKA